MGSQKTDRQKQNRAHARQLAAERARHRKNRRLLKRLGAVAAVLLAALLVAWMITQSGDKKNETASEQASSSLDQGSNSPAGSGDCPAADGSSPRTTSFTSAPSSCIDATKTYTAQVETNKGNFTIALDATKAPATVNNFVFLSRYHFYDGLTFHRIIPGFMSQGGDPKGDGTGGPGYSFKDELPGSSDDYVEGAVAMANSGPDTNGSQFFIMAPGYSGLSPNYSIFGHVTDGLDVTNSINKLGDASGKPSEAVTITRVTIVESGGSGASSLDEPASPGSQADSGLSSQG